MTQQAPPPIMYKTCTFNPATLERVADDQAFTKSIGIDGMIKAAIPFDAPEGLDYYVASDGGLDLDGDIIVQEGLDWSQIKAGMPWVEIHDYDVWMLGAIKFARQVGNETIIGVLWDIEDERAQYVKGKYDRGFATACSIGFNPEQWSFLENGEGRYKIEKAAVIEVSAVPIGANPRARRLGEKTVTTGDDTITVDELMPYITNLVEAAAERGFEKGWAKCLDCHGIEDSTAEETTDDAPQADEVDGADDTQEQAQKTPEEPTGPEEKRFRFVR